MLKIQPLKYYKYTSNAHSENKRAGGAFMVRLQVDIFEPQIIELVALYCR